MAAEDDQQKNTFDCVEEVFRGSPCLCTHHVYHTMRDLFDTSSLVILGVTDERVFYKVNVYADEQRKPATLSPRIFSSCLDTLVERAFTRSPYEWAKTNEFKGRYLTSFYSKPWHPWDAEGGITHIPRDYDRALRGLPVATHGKGHRLAAAWRELLLVFDAGGRVLYAQPFPGLCRPLQKQIRLGLGFVVMGVEHIAEGGNHATPSVLVAPLPHNSPTSSVQPINLNPGDELICFEVCDVWDNASGVSSIYVFFKRDGVVQMREVRYDVRANKISAPDDCARYERLPFTPLAARLTEDGQVLSILDRQMRLWLLSHEGISTPVPLIVGGDQTPFFKDFRVFHEFLPNPPAEQTDARGFAIPGRIYSRLGVVLALNTGVIRFRSVIRFYERVYNLQQILNDNLSALPRGRAFLEDACYESVHLVNSIAVSPSWVCCALESQQLMCATPATRVEPQATASSSSSSSSSQ